MVAMPLMATVVIPVVVATVVMVGTVVMVAMVVLPMVVVPMVVRMGVVPSQSVWILLFFVEFWSREASYHLGYALLVESEQFSAAVGL
jgi:hypothetical protein